MLNYKKLVYSVIDNYDTSEKIQEVTVNEVVATMNTVFYALRQMSALTDNGVYKLEELGDDLDSLISLIETDHF